MGCRESPSGGTDATGNTGSNSGHCPLTGHTFQSAEERPVALWKNADDLTDAQQAKLDWTARRGTLPAGNIPRRGAPGVLRG